MKRLHRDFDCTHDDSVLRPSKMHKLEVLNHYPLVEGRPSLDPYPIELDISHYVTHSSAKLLRELSQLCPNVSTLNLSFWNYLTDDDLSLLLGNHNTVLPNIEILNISHTQVTDSGIKIITSKCPNLTSIDLNGCHDITDVSLSLLAQNCKNLQHLRISGCSHIGDIGVQLVAQEAKHHLQTLDVNDCPLVTDKTLMYLGYYCPNLSCLRLKNTGVSIGVLAKLLSSRLHLLELNVQGLPITDSFLLLLLRVQQTLKILDISFCFHVSISVLQKFIEELDLLEELHLFGLATSLESVDWEVYSSKHGLSIFF